MIKKLTIGIPAYHAEKTLPILLSSILIQTIVDDTVIIIANDEPKDNNKYEFLKNLYPTLNIEILSCYKNTGPGLARQRCLDKCNTEWIMFIDADDILASPFSLENLMNNISLNCISVQGPFLQEVTSVQRLKNPTIPKIISRNEIGHPWVFGRIYNVKFLKENNIGFSNLRAMEDGEFNWKVKIMAEIIGAEINLIEEPVYLWKAGSEQSITTIGAEYNNGEPLYNWDLCQFGGTIAAINAIKFCEQQTNTFSSNVLNFIIETMIKQYFAYIECTEKSPLFIEQNWFNAKRFYYQCYKDIENQIDIDVLKSCYLQYSIKTLQNMVGIIPQITFFDFIEKIKLEEFGGKKEFEQIRAKLPNWVNQLDKQTGMLGEESYIYTIGEK